MNFGLRSDWDPHFHAPHLGDYFALVAASHGEYSDYGNSHVVGGAVRVELERVCEKKVRQFACAGDSIAEAIC